MFYNSVKLYETDRNKKACAAALNNLVRALEASRAENFPYDENTFFFKTNEPMSLKRLGDIR